jgi:hypothetical protein
VFDTGACGLHGRRHGIPYDLLVLDHYMNPRNQNAIRFRLRKIAS